MVVISPLQGKEEPDHLEVMEVQLEAEQVVMEAFFQVEVGEGALEDLEDLEVLEAMVLVVVVVVLDLVEGLQVLEV